MTDNMALQSYVSQAELYLRSKPLWGGIPMDDLFLSYCHVHSYLQSGPACLTWSLLIISWEEECKNTSWAEPALLASHIPAFHFKKDAVSAGPPQKEVTGLSSDEGKSQTLDNLH